MKKVSDTQGMLIGMDGKRAVLNNTGLGNYSRYAVNILSLAYPGASSLLLLKMSVRLSSPFTTSYGGAVRTTTAPLTAGFMISNTAALHGVQRAGLLSASVQSATL